MKTALQLCAIFWLCMACTVKVFAGEVIMPPLEYDHPFHGRLIVETLPYWDVNSRCGTAERGRYDACSWTFQGYDGLGCHIIYPRLSDVGERMMVELIRHETSHCNGWRADHPDGYYE